MLKIKAQEYFRKFENRDIDGIRILFSASITLQDWENNIEGIEEVLEVYKRIFSSSENIKVKIKRIYSQDLSVIAELDLEINESQILSVVDIIDYDEKYFIKKITAFKG